MKGQDEPFAQVSRQPFFSERDIIKVPKGDVLRGVRSTDRIFKGFAELYFSKITPGVVKGWKLHTVATLNLIVTLGRVRFVVLDGHPHEETTKVALDVVVSKDNYGVVTVPPHFWLSFGNISDDDACIANVCDVIHDRNEAREVELQAVDPRW